MFFPSLCEKKNSTIKKKAKEAAFRKSTVPVWDKMMSKENFALCCSYHDSQSHNDEHHKDTPGNNLTKTEQNPATTRAVGAVHSICEGKGNMYQKQQVQPSPILKQTPEYNMQSDSSQLPDYRTLNVFNVFKPPEPTPTFAQPTRVSFTRNLYKFQYKLTDCRAQVSSPVSRYSQNSSNILDRPPTSSSGSNYQYSGSISAMQQRQQAYTVDASKYRLDIEDPSFSSSNNNTHAHTYTHTAHNDNSDDNSSMQNNNNSNSNNSINLSNNKGGIDQIIQTKEREISYLNRVRRWEREKVSVNKHEGWGEEKWERGEQGKVTEQQ